MATTHAPDIVGQAVADAATFIHDLLTTDSRDQKQIARTARISPGQLTHLKQGHRALTPSMARKLARAWPEHTDTLTGLAYTIDDARDEVATLRATVTHTLEYVSRQTYHHILAPFPAIAA